MIERIYTCQDCDKTSTDSGLFKVVKYKNIGMVMCGDCVKKVKGE